MIQIIDLVDSVDYATTNCFQSQLTKVLNSTGLVTTVQLSDINKYPNPDKIVCRLKQRTLFKQINIVHNWANDAPVVIYDQDPWHAFMDDSPYKGAYDLFLQHLNVKSFAVTTKWWADFLNKRGMQSKFVKMWLLPPYCDRGPLHDSSQRWRNIAFIGTLHSHRKQLFDELEKYDIRVTLLRNELSYPDFLRALGTIRIFLHSEDVPITINGALHNLNTGLWIKDIEACARGCYSIRNVGADSETYLESVKTALLYDSVEQVPELIKSIEKMDPTVRQESIDSTVRFIKQSNEWSRTAATLIA